MAKATLKQLRTYFSSTHGCNAGRWMPVPIQMAELKADGGCSSEDRAELQELLGKAIERYPDIAEAAGPAK